MDADLTSEKLATEREKNWKLKLALKDRCIEDLTDKLAATERQVKKLSFDRGDTEEALKRKARLLDEENSLLQAKLGEVLNILERLQNAQSEPKQQYASAENRYRQALDLAKVTGGKLEEAEFTADQLKLANTALRDEVLQLTEQLQTERTTNCKLEIHSVELREKVANYQMRIKSIETLQAKADQEILISLENNQKIEKGLLEEKKRRIELERQKEELSFAASKSEKKLSDEVYHLQGMLASLKEEYAQSRKEAETANERLRTALNTEIQGMNTLSRKMKLLEEENKEVSLELRKTKDHLDSLLAHNEKHTCIKDMAARQALIAKLNQVRSSLKALKRESAEMQKQIIVQADVSFEQAAVNLRRYAGILAAEPRGLSTPRQNRGFYDFSSSKKLADNFKVALYPLSTQQKTQTTPSKQSVFTTSPREKTVSKLTERRSPPRKHDIDLKSIEADNEEIAMRIARLKSHYR